MMRRMTWAQWVLVGMLTYACGDGSTGASRAPLVPPEPLPGDPECASFESTFAAIEEVIFDQKGCTTKSCHGDAQVGGLDLRRGDALARLVDVSSMNSDLKRIDPGSPGTSFLFRKLQAATNPGSVAIGGSPMPVCASRRGRNRSRGLHRRVASLDDPIVGGRLLALRLHAQPAEELLAVLARELELGEHQA